MMSVAEDVYRDPEATVILNRGRAAMAAASDKLAKLRALSQTAFELESYNDQNLIGDLSNSAIDVQGLEPNEVQTIISGAIKRSRERGIAWKAWPKPDMRLIEDDRVPVPVIDEGILPVGWGSWIESEAAACACPVDYVAAGLIGAASVWIGNARRVAATSDWNEPAHLWFSLIGGPSAGKTPSLKAMISVSRAIERDAEKEWRGEHANDQQPPPRPRMMVMDATTEELQRLLADNPRGLMSVRDELSGWLSGFDRYRSNGKGSDRAFFLECWNGGAYVCDRAKFHEAPIRIEHASLAIIGGMVPDRLREALADTDDGLAARFLYVWPEPIPVEPLKDRGEIETCRRRGVLSRAALRLRALEMGEDQYGTPAPHALRLDDYARHLFNEVRSTAMRRARESSGLAAGWHGKNPGRALRLALVYQLLTWSAHGDGEREPITVTDDAMARAAGYLDYAAAMMERIEGGLAIGRAETDAAAIARYLLETSAPALNERELYQSAGWAWLRRPGRRAPALRILEEAAWIRRPTSEAGKLGRKRHDWDVSPRIVEDFP
jgi:hypothetical protein